MIDVFVIWIDRGHLVEEVGLVLSIESGEYLLSILPELRRDGFADL